MRMRTVLIGVFALIFGVSAAAGVFLMMSTAPVAPKVETVPVIIAAVDINRGQTLAAADVTKSDWPKGIVPVGALTKLEEVIDRTAAIPLIKGDLLLEGKLAAKGAGRGMAAIIPAGMRAVTITTPNVATGVAGFILPGNKVDILLTMNNQGADDHTGGGSTITLLQNVEILAVDQRTDVPQDNKMDSKDLRSVTLLVTPSEAARLDLGQNKGTLRLTLRNPTDKLTDYVEPIALTELSLNSAEIDQHRKDISPLAIVPVSAPPVARPKPVIPQIRTLRGLQSGRSQIPVLIEGPTDVTDVSAKPLASSVP